MSASPETTSPAPMTAPPVAPASPAGPRAGMSALARVVLVLALLLAVAAAAAAGVAWRQVYLLQKQVSKQVADMGLQSRDSGTLARLASEQSREASAKVALLDQRVVQLDAQRAQVDSVLQGLSRAKDDNLLVDVDSVVQMGLQQTQLTGSVQPLLAALISSEKRLENVTQPRLVALQLAMAQDIEQLRKTSVSDVAMLATRIDNVLRQIDSLPLQSDMAPLPSTGGNAPVATRVPAGAPWWQQWWGSILDTALGLVRVRAIASRDAALLPPDQGMLVRENLKLRLLNARMALMSRQSELARNDVEQVQAQLKEYFQADSPLVDAAQKQLQEVHKNIHSAELPQIRGTLEALTAANAAASVAGN